MPLVSVLIPAHNHARWIIETLESVLDEDYRPLEVIVIDDGSQDETLARVRGWATLHPEIEVRSFGRENRGITRTLNELLASARGQYVVPLASDDRLLPGGIQRRIDALRAVPGARAIFGDCHVIDESGERVADSGLTDLYSANKNRLRTNIGAEIISNWGVPGPVLLAERAGLVSAGGYDESLHVEDWDLYLRLAARSWLTFVDVPVAEYRRHSGGASAQISLRHAQEMYAVARRSVRLYRGKNRLLMRRQVFRWRAVKSRLAGRWIQFLVWGLVSRSLKFLTAALR